MLRSGCWPPQRLEKNPGHARAWAVASNARREHPKRGGRDQVLVPLLLRKKPKREDLVLVLALAFETAPPHPGPAPSRLPRPALRRQAAEAHRERQRDGRGLDWAIKKRGGERERERRGRSRRIGGGASTVDKSYLFFLFFGFSILTSRREKKRRNEPISSFSPCSSSRPCFARSDYNLI